MKLAELEPQLIKRTATGWRTDATFADCDGLEFLCPKCWLANNGPVGTHMVICWKPGVPLEISPGPGRWAHQGTGLADISLVAGSSSVKLEGGCNAHFHVTAGEIVGLT